jgi:hypothetical protein
MIESLVAVLLVFTIGYCVILNSRLKRLKADEQSMKATISELITATENAERAVNGLRGAAQDCEDTLGERLKSAERFSADLSRQIKVGEITINRLSRVLVAARPALETAPPATDRPDPKSVAVAAQEFADRLRERAAALAA